MTEEVCELWELPVSMCGCPRHRGGQTPEEEAAETYRPSPWFAAQWPGECARCHLPFPEGHLVRYDGGNDGALECCNY